MDKHLRTIRILLIAFLIVSGDGLSRSQSTSSSKVIDGLVTEYGTQLPLEGVRISVTSGEFSKSVTSDAAGRFVVEAVPPGRYRVEATKNDFVLTRLPRITFPREPWVSLTISVNSGDQHIQLEMVRGGVIFGQVLDENGKPIANTSLLIQKYAYDQYGQRVLMSVPGITYLPNSDFSAVTTNDRGEYRFYGLPPGEYVLRETIDSCDRGAHFRVSVV